MRTGIISYINSIPFAFGLEKYCNVVRRPPAELAKSFEEGLLDVSFMPSVAYLRGGRRHALVDGLSISSFGPTNSVFLCMNESTGNIRSVALSPESTTSNFIVREILSRKYGIRPNYVDGSAECADARIVIGDNALRLAGTFKGILDVGTEWMSMTGLPMVYAVCVARNQELASEAGRIIRHVRDTNLGALERILAESNASQHLDYLKGLDYGLDMRHRRTLGIIESFLNESESKAKGYNVRNNHIYRWLPALQAS